MSHRNMDKGKGFLILYLTPSKAASALVSDMPVLRQTGPLQIVNVFPNYTLGGFFGALYQSNSEATYGSLVEFYTISALTKWNGRRRFYLNPIDPMRRPDLIWEKKHSGIFLYGRGDPPGYISIKIMPIAPGLPFHFCLPFIEIKGEGVILPKSIPVSKAAISASSVYIPSSSPLSILPFRGKVFTIAFSLGQAVLEEQKLFKGEILKELKTGVCGRIT